MEHKVFAEKCIQVDPETMTLKKGYTVLEFVPEEDLPAYCEELGRIPEIKPDHGFYMRLEPHERNALVSILKREMERLNERMQDHEPGSWFYNKDLDDWKMVHYLHFICAPDLPFSDEEGGDE